MTLGWLANLGTVFTTGVLAWGIASKILANVRRRLPVGLLTPWESQIIALMLAAMFMVGAIVLLLSISSHSLVEQHTVLLHQFNRAAAVVKHDGTSIERVGSAISAALGKLSTLLHKILAAVDPGGS